MTNALYPKWKEALMQASANSALTGTVKAALIDSAVQGYDATDDFWDDISAAVIGTPQTLANKTFGSVAASVFDADDVTFTAVTGASVEAIVIFIDTGTPATSRLVAWIDTGYTNLPVTPNSGNIGVSWAAGGIFAL